MENCTPGEDQRRPWERPRIERLDIPDDTEGKITTSAIEYDLFTIGPS